MRLKRIQITIISTVTSLWAAFLCVGFLIPPKHGATKANFDRLKDGMQRYEVEEILGGGDVVEGSEVWVGIEGKIYINYHSTDDGRRRIHTKIWQDSEMTYFDRARSFMRRLFP